MFKLDLEKAEGPEIKFQHPLDNRKGKSSRKTSISTDKTLNKRHDVFCPCEMHTFSWGKRKYTSKYIKAKIMQ